MRELNTRISGGNYNYIQGLHWPFFRPLDMDLRHERPLASTWSSADIYE